jgi:hypothetical protein
MRQSAAFAELLRQHEELTQRFAQLLHDDAGQILTSIALQLSALDGVDPKELETLTGTLDELLERFRDAQASLGGAVVAKRGLAAGLSQLARQRGNLRVDGDDGPCWPVHAAQAGFRIVEALQPQRVVLDAQGMLLEGSGVAGDYVSSLAEVGELVLREGPRANTIRIDHANQGSNR